MNATKHSGKVKVIQGANHGPLRIMYQELPVFPRNTQAHKKNNIGFCYADD